MSNHNNLKCKCGKPQGHPGGCPGGGGGKAEEKKQGMASKADHQKTDRTSIKAISTSRPITLCALWGNYQNKLKAVMAAPKPNASKNLTKGAKKVEVSTLDPQTKGSKQSRNNISLARLSNKLC